LAEFCELPLNDQKHAKKIYNGLKESEQTWYTLLIRDFQADGGLFSFLQTQYHRNKILFCQIYALKKFSDNIGNTELIINKAREILGEDFPGYEILTGDDPRGLILPIFHRSRDAIIDLYCDNVMKNSKIKTYNAILGFSQGHPSEISMESIQRIMNAFQRGKGRDRRKIHVMWVKNHNGKIKIIFRKDKRSTTVIKKTEHNEAIKTADQKIFVFEENGSILSAYLGREPKKTLEIAQHLAGKLFGRTIIFNEDIIKKPVRVLDRFIDAMQQENNQRVKLFAITAVNTPLSNSPKIEIRSRGRGLINQNIIELISTSHALPLVTNHSDLLNVTVQIQEQKFKLHFEIEGESVVIKCSDKGYNTEKKRLISEYFDSFNVDDSNANSH
jgi:hypothetical protein